MLAVAGVAGLFTCTAAAFAGISILVALWDTHPALAAGLVATEFALLAVIALLILRRPPL
jgi:hypothetical protein